MAQAATLETKPDTTKKRKKPEQEYDPIFFRKADLCVGRQLVYKGRLDPNTRWTIIKIRSDKGVGKGMKNVDSVQKLTDYITVRSDDGRIREITFAYASYSAIWQLPRNV